MTNERKKKPVEETQTEFGPVSGDGLVPAPSEQPEDPELEVRLPQDDTDTSPNLLDDTASSSDPDKPIELSDSDAPVDEPFADDSDDLTRTDLLTGPLDPRVHDPATGDENRLLEVRMDPEAADDTATATSDEPTESPTETGLVQGETLTELGALFDHQGVLPAGAESDESDAPPDDDEADLTRTDVVGEGIEALKALARLADETKSAVADPTRTRWDPDAPTNDLEDPHDPEGQTVDLPELDPDGETADLQEAPVPGFNHEGATLDVGGEPATGSPPSAGDGPAYEVQRIEVPAATFVDTYYERHEDQEREERRSRAPTRRSWRDRLERAKPTPWRDLALWAAQRLDPRPWWQGLRDKRRRREGEDPTNQQVAKDAAHAVVGWVASAIKPRAEIAAEHDKGWWRRTTIETLALFLMVVPIEWSLTGSVGSFDTHPHPYWLIVLPMAAARGVVAGLLAAAVASVLYALGAMGALEALKEAAKLTGDEVPDDIFTFGQMLETILFFVVAFFTGELHDEMASRYRKQRRRLDDVQERSDSLRQERDVLRDANRELEKRIVDASLQFGNLIISAERIENSGRTEVFDIALELIEEHCGASSSVLLRLEDSSLDFLCHRGWDAGETSDRLAIARESDIVQRAIKEGRIINGFEEGETAPASGPLVVAPLFDSSGLVKALLCLDDVPETRLNPSTITTFLGIANWIGSVLTRLARTDEATRNAQAPRAATTGSLWLGSSDDLGDRLRLELERCARYGVPTSFLAIQLSTLTDTTRDGLETADRFIASHFTTGLRPSDNIYRFGYPGCYLLVLAGTSVSGAEVVKSRLLRRIDYTASDSIGPVEIFASGPDVDAPDLVSLVGRVAERLRGNSVLALEGQCPVKVPEHGEVLGPADLVRRLRMEVSLALRHSLDFNAVAIRVHGDRPGAIGTLARHLSEAGDAMLRATDGIYEVDPDCIAIVMPSTRADEAATLSHRIVQALRERDTAAIYGDVETAVISLNTVNPDAHAMLLALGFPFSPEISA